MSGQKVNYDAKTGDIIEVKTSFGWIELVVQDTHKDCVSFKDGSGRDTYYTYSRLIEMSARFIQGRSP